MRGRYKHAYQLFTSYFVEVRLVDLNLVFDIQTASYKDKIFTRCFWCFGTPKIIYKLLRPVIVIDKTFLKGRYCGTLFVFSVTGSETIESWTYFLEMLGSNFYVFNTRFVIISDRNPEIINVVPNVFSLLSIRFVPSTYRTTLKLPSKAQGSHLG
ncbi:hypothetical protein GIB67_015730 [Kingdonia uniflora]|uniref:MULE transposase domain-containing protein n=1 Tax=Kingdonia uniflora TaxID=39325 RepID=A0A7J7NV38_9MAGN|nr:hypothetical protein GIB67_015730 [Kingdonia uniflora]